MMQTKPKILVVRGGGMGDVIMTTPIVRELYNDYGGFCEIFVQTGFPDVFKNSPYVSGINPPQQNYDAIYDLRLSYENNPKIHTVHAYKWSVFGNVEMEDYSLDIFSSPEDKVRIDAFNYENYIVIHMRQHNWPSRNLRPEFWQTLVSKILDATDLNIIQVGGLHEVAFGGSPRLISDLGKYSINELKYLIDGARAFIGIDGGLIHVAACTDTPLISFFTSCREEYRRPLKDSIKFYPIEADIECYGCQEDNPPPCTEFICKKGDVPCIDTFDASEVVATLVRAIQ